MKRADRIERISKLSRTYAQSGNYGDWSSIERALVRQGLPEARIYLDRRHLRAELDAMCKFARSAKARGLTYMAAVREAQSRLSQSQDKTP